MTIDPTSTKPSKAQKPRRNRADLYLPMSLTETWRASFSEHNPIPTDPHRTRPSRPSTGSAAIIDFTAERQRRMRTTRIAG